MMQLALDRTVSQKRIARILTYLTCAGLLAGCAQLGPAQTPEEIISLRGQARWDAVVAGDWAKAYGYNTPAYRAAVDLYGFRSKADGFIKFKSAKVEGVKCEEADSCKLKLRVVFATLDGHFGDTNTLIQEPWVKDSGEWWRYSEF